jgi:hypothetical protein
MRVSKIDIYRTANELIKQHCEDAPIHAAMRADELLDAGDLDGQAVWKRVLAAIGCRLVVVGNWETTRRIIRVAIVPSPFSHI